MLFDSTVRRELARSFGATLVVILTIVLTMFLIRTIGQAAKGTVAPGDVVLLLGFVTLGHLPTMLALSLFVAIVVTLGRMFRDSEMVIWFASGAALSRFVRPVLRTAWPVLVVIALLLMFVWPWGNRQSQELRERYEQRSDLSRVAPGAFQSSSDGQRVFFIERDPANASAARNVFILSRPPGSESVTSAHSGLLQVSEADRFLVLQAGQRNEIDTRTGDKTLARFETYRMRVEERVAVSAQARPPRATRTIELLRQDTNAAQGELVWRFGLCLAACNMALLGIALSVTNPRKPSNWNLLLALLAFIVYFNLVNLSQGWVTAGQLAALPAMLGLHGSAFTLALAMIFWQERVAVWRLRRRGPGGAHA